MFSSEICFRITLPILNQLNCQISHFVALRNLIWLILTKFLSYLIDFKNPTIPRQYPTSSANLLPSRSCSAFHSVNAACSVMPTSFKLPSFPFEMSKDPSTASAWARRNTAIHVFTSSKSFLAFNCVVNAETKSQSSLLSLRILGSSERISRSNLAGERDLRNSMNGPNSLDWWPECRRDVNWEVCRLVPFLCCNFTIRDRSEYVVFPTSPLSLTALERSESAFVKDGRKKGACRGAFGASAGLFRCWKS